MPSLLKALELDAEDELVPKRHRSAPNAQKSHTGASATSQQQQPGGGSSAQSRVPSGRRKVAKSSSKAAQGPKLTPATEGLVEAHNREKVKEAWAKEKSNLEEKFKTLSEAFEALTEKAQANWQKWNEEKLRLQGDLNLTRRRYESDMSEWRSPFELNARQLVQAKA